MDNASGCFDASQALAQSLQCRLEHETHSKRLADRVLRELEERIREESSAGRTRCRWVIPHERFPELDLAITRKAVRHFLRYNGYWWHQDAGGPNEYVVWWQPEHWHDYLIGNNWDSRYKWFPLGHNSVV